MVKYNVRVRFVVRVRYMYRQVPDLKSLILMRPQGIRLGLGLRLKSKN